MPLNLPIGENFYFFYFYKITLGLSHIARIVEKDVEISVLSFSGRQPNWSLRELEIARIEWENIAQETKQKFKYKK